MKTRTNSKQETRIESAPARRCPVVRVAHWLEELFRDFAWNG